MCPYCEAEYFGSSSGWAMHPDAMRELKERHDAGHPENEKSITSVLHHCPNCGSNFSPLNKGEIKLEK